MRLLGSRQQPWKSAVSPSAAHSELEDKNFKRHFRRAAPAIRPAGGHCSRSDGCSPSTRRQHSVVDCSKVWRGLDRRLRRRDAEGSGAFRCEGLGAGRREKLGGFALQDPASEAQGTRRKW
jgi:hypothetical protein